MKYALAHVSRCSCMLNHLLRNVPLNIHCNHDSYTIDGVSSAYVIVTLDNDSAITQIVEKSIHLIGIQDTLVVRKFLTIYALHIFTIWWFKYMFYSSVYESIWTYMHMNLYEWQLSGMYLCGYSILSRLRKNKCGYCKNFFRFRHLFMIILVPGLSVS